jgi:hypothetical protein
MTHNHLNARLAVLEKKRTELLKQLYSYDDNMLNRKPAEGAWSVAQVLHHLLLAEEGTVAYLKSKSKDLSQSHKSGLKGHWRYLLLYFAFLFPFKFKSPKAIIPSGDFLSIQEIDTKWLETRKAMKAIWMAIPEDILNNNLFKHPRAGKLSLMQMLDFFDLHYSKHENQIQRTIKAVS